MKKFISILMALVMTMSLLCVNAFAAEKLAPIEDSNHSYTAYQIFSGVQKDGNAMLIDAKWGSGIDSAAFLAALKDDATIGAQFADCTTASDVALAMKDWTDKSANAMAFAKVAKDYVKGNGVTVVNGQTELDAGYYLVVDTTAEVGEGDAYNLALLQLTKKGTFEIAQKSSVPEVEKKVNNGLICANTNEAHVHDKTCYDWKDANKAAFGDTVNFMISSAVPATAVNYDYYYFIVGDKLSDGLTFDLAKANMKVTIGGEPAVAGEDYTVQDSYGNYTFAVALTDAIAHAGEEVVVTYDATVNTGAVIGVAGNPNKVDVTYSHKPDAKYDGTTDESHPGFPDSKKTVPTGTTPEDITLTFVTQIKLFKVDENNRPLQGAEFTLTGDALNIVMVAKNKFAQAIDGTYYKLLNGSYTEVAPVARHMEDAAADAEKGYVVAEDDYEGTDKITVNGTVYRAYVPATDKNVKIFVLVESNEDLYESTSVKYKATTELEQQTKAEGVDIKATVDESGIVIFKGLNAGEYTLEETKVPTGYNKIDNIDFEIVCTLPTEVTTGEENCTWDVAEDDTSGVEYVEADNAFEITIVNHSGTELPETGGMGTTLFYVMGGILVAAAAVLFVTKKRMSTEG